MADSELQILTGLTTVAVSDILYIVGDPAGTPLSRKVTVADLFGAVSGPFIINEAGADQDFRVESDANSHMLFLDAGNDRIGIGNMSPQELLHVGAGTDGSDITATDLLVTRAGPSSLSVRDSTNNVETFLFASSVGGIMGTVTNDPLNIQTNNTSAIFIDASQNVGIGITVPAAKAHIDQASTTAATPVLLLDQADVDEDYIKIIGISDTSADRALVDAVDFSTIGALKGFLKINVQDDQATNPIVDGDYYIPFYAVPTA